jgi:hypothetical protein
MFAGFSPGDALSEVAKTGSYADLADKPVTQTTGDSEDLVMSQKATTDALALKQDKLTAGENISIEDNVISAESGDAGNAALGELDDLQMEARIMSTNAAWTPVTFYRTFAGVPCVAGSCAGNYVISAQNVTATGCEVAARDSGGTFYATTVNIIIVYDGGVT